MSDEKKQVAESESVCAFHGYCRGWPVAVPVEDDHQEEDDDDEYEVSTPLPLWEGCA